MQKQINRPWFVRGAVSVFICVFALCALFWGGQAFAQEKEETEETEQASSVEMNGDRLEFSMKENKAIASGNVSIKKDNVTLLCDELEYFKDSKLAIAKGNVVLIQSGERVTGEQLTFNFETMKGDFKDATIAAKPFFGSGRKVTKVGENHIQIDQGRLTTCDYDKPHFSFLSRKIDVYPGEKATARNVRLLVGKIPLLYIPRFTQDLRDKKPVFIITPGYDKNWGPFVLTKWRYALNDAIDGVVHLDYRQKKDFAWGVDLNYKTAKFGEGLIRTYYMNERSVETDFYEERISPTIERERFKVQWRHKWQIDDKTSTILQYYRMSDAQILKDYFERAYEDDTSPSTYFLLTRGLSFGTLSLRADARVNRFESMVERLPELNLDITNRQIAETGLYFKNSTTFSNLTKVEATPSFDRRETMRFDVDSEVSYPAKLGFVEFKPYAGGQHTYYSKTISRDDYNSIRGIFRTGADLSTKFYRIFDVNTNWMDLDINRLRHIITPTVSYQYIHDPTIPDSKLDQFDSIDSLTRAHSVVFGLEQKLQTKRDLMNVDLVRVSVSTDFLLKEDTGPGGFNSVSSDFELTPYEWLSLYIDTAYDAQSERLATANFDIYINDESDKWYLKLGKRYNVDVDDQLTAEWGYRINPKWKFRTYQRFDLDTGVYKEMEFNLNRDLHCWEMDINFNHTRGEGDEIWLVFTLKAFPEIGFDFGSSFNKRKPGAQAE